MKPSPLFWYIFGPFKLCPSERLLLREGIAVTLTPRTFDTLAFLVKNAPNLVTTEALVSAVWDVPEVEPANVAQQVYFARKALNDSAKDRKFNYIENVARSGYRFIAKVEEREEQWKLAEEDLGPANGTPPLSDGATAAATHRPYVGWLIALIGACLLGILAALAQAIVPLQAKVVKYKQLTFDGRQKAGPLLTDGKVIVFREAEGFDGVMAVPVSGGSPLPVPGTLAGSAPSDLSPDGAQLLFYRSGAHGSELWSTPLKGGNPQLLGDAWDGSWAPDGRTLALAGEDLLSINRPGEPPKAVEVPKRARNLRWSPDGRKIRFDVIGPEAASLWEVSANGSGLHQLTELSSVSKMTQGGVWSPDGKYFLFEAGLAGANNIWVARAGGIFSRFLKTRPVPLPTGPGTWRFPLVAKDSSRVFAIHEVPRPELVFLDSASGAWRPYWTGDVAYEIDFSRDSRRIAYVHYPDNTLWTARSDNTDKRQLTNLGFEVHQPHWSPDGARIAFRARTGGGYFQVYIIAAGGGSPRPVWSSAADQGVPTWSPDGKHLIFGDRPGVKPAAYMAIHSVDVSTGQVTDLPDSNGLWNARWSPDGKRIVAVSADRETLYALPSPGSGWQQLLRMRFIDNLSWSADSRSLYFDGKRDVDHMELFRLEIKPGAVPRVLADLKNFAWMPANWFGSTPSGIPLALHDAAPQEIFALECEFR